MITIELVPESKCPECGARYAEVGFTALPLGASGGWLILCPGCLVKLASTALREMSDICLAKHGDLDAHRKEKDPCQQN